MRERPILFSGAMVRAILQGRKQQTRRVVKLPASPDHLGAWEPTELSSFTRSGEYVSLPGIWHTRTGQSFGCPYGRPGDRLWVRETHAGDNLCGWVYRADHPAADISAGDLDDGEQSLRRWRPAIHMKREACRLVLDSFRELMANGWLIATRGRYRLDGEAVRRVHRRYADV